MATVTSNLTRINDIEGALTLVSVGGGSGGSANTDIFLQGAQSAGRRQSSVTLNGFLLNDGGANNLSAADVHLGVWLWVTQYDSLTALRFRVGDSTGSANYDEHIIPLTEYPSLGGWLRAWIDISRTPDATGGTALNEANAQYFGPIISLPTVGGTSQNLIMDAIDHTTTGLSLTGTSGVWQDFLTADEDNTTNKYGVVNSISGIIYCRARLTLGTASSLVFNDSNFTIVFPQQNTVADNFMGITVDLQNASTNIDWASGVINSPGTKKGDLVITGTSGDFDATGMALSGLRLITLTSASSFLSSSFTSCGQITGAGAIFTNNTVSGYTGATDTSAFVWDVATDPDGYLDGTSFTKGSGTTHAIEFGTSSPTTMTLVNVDFSGYNVSDGQNDSAIHIKRTTGTVTINIDGGTTPSYKTDGATVTIVSGTVSVSVNVKDASDGSNIQNARVFIETSDNTGPFPFEDTVTITRSGATATVAHTAHGMATNDKVVIRNANQNEYNGIHQITYIDANSYSYSVSGSPATPATGTILCSFVALEGLTDASGNITTSRVYSSSQPIKGKVRKSTSAPYYVTGGIGGTVNNTTGFSAGIQLISDD